MFHIRSEKTTDFFAIREVNNLAFGGENESNLIENLRKSSQFNPNLSIVAESDLNGIIGHILFSRITIETINEQVESIALAPMAVKPDFQNLGIGSALVKEGLERCKQLGWNSVVVLGHPTFYPKFGFVPASSKGIKAPFHVRDEVFMVLELKENSLANVEGVVKYPNAFLEV